MRRGEVRQRVTKNGEQAPLKPKKDADTVGPHQTKKHDKLVESSSSPPESRWEGASEPRDLPDSYGETRLVLLPVEPYVLHVYWEVPSVERDKARDELGDMYRRSQASLRCYDITNIIFDGANAHSSFYVDIDLQANNCYISLWSPEKSYCVELGFRTEDGRFYPIVRSNIAETPPMWLSPKADEHYMLVEGDYAVVKTAPAPTAVPLHLGLSPQTTKRQMSTQERYKVEGIETAGTEFMIAVSREREGPVDLAEMSEKGFTFGVSSN